MMLPSFAAETSSCLSGTNLQQVMGRLWPLSSRRSKPRAASCCLIWGSRASNLSFRLMSWVRRGYQAVLQEARDFLVRIVIGLFELFALPQHPRLADDVSGHPQARLVRRFLLHLRQLVFVCVVRVEGIVVFDPASGQAYRSSRSCSGASSSRASFFFG